MHNQETAGEKGKKKKKGGGGHEAIKYFLE